MLTIAASSAWSSYVATRLPTLGGTGSEAYGINNAGQVVGLSRTAGNLTYRATLWSGGAAIDLGEDRIFKRPFSFRMAPRTRHPTRVSRSLKVAENC